MTASPDDCLYLRLPLLMTASLMTDFIQYLAIGHAVEKVRGGARARALVGLPVRQAPLLLGV